MVKYVNFIAEYCALLLSLQINCIRYMAYDVKDIANLLLLSAESYSGGELMTNMKLQKMLYYQQGFHLAYFDTPLFDDEIEAWMYGPVVKSV